MKANKQLNFTILQNHNKWAELQQICLHNFYAFCSYLSGDTLNLNQKWIYHITKELQDFTTSTELNRMIINACPRLGKTTIASILYGVWYIAKYPNRKILFLTASNGTLEALSFTFNEIIGSDKFKKLFPDFAFKNNTIASKITNQNGFIQFVVAGSNVTGRGFHLAIFDDFINPQHLKSEVRRTSAIENFRRFLGRKEYNPATKILIVEQRFSINDITANAKEIWDGYLLYKQIIYPYQFQEKVLLPYLKNKYIVFEAGEFVDVKFDEVDKITIQRERGIQVWQSEYLQQPIEIPEGALFDNEMINNAKNTEFNNLSIEKIRQKMSYIVIGVDPAITSDVRSDLTGIIVCGYGEDNLYYVLDDISGRYKPHQWAQNIEYLANKWSANIVVAEGNQGGEMITDILRRGQLNIPVNIVHARYGKITRAEPIANLYSNQLVKHINNIAGDGMNKLYNLENEMLHFAPLMSAKSPDRMDAMVWALTFLLQRVNDDLNPRNLSKSVFRLG